MFAARGEASENHEAAFASSKSDDIRILREPRRFELNAMDPFSTSRHVAKAVPEYHACEIS